MNYIEEIIQDKDKIIYAYLHKLKRKYPFLNQFDLNKAGDIFINRFENKMVEIFNSHTCESFKLSATQFIRKIFTDNLILIENGVLFTPNKGQKDLSPLLESESFLYNNRTVMKGEMKYYDDPKRGNDPIKAVWFNNSQNACKEGMNSIYGLMQTLSSLFNNCDLPTSITCRGRSVVSVTAMNLEGALGGYFPKSLEGISETIFKCTEEIVYIKETNKVLYDEIVNIKVDMSTLINHLKVLPKNRDIVTKILSNIDSDVWSLLYHKNNVDQFLILPSVKSLFDRLFSYINSTNKPYVNPYTKDTTISELKNEIDKYLIVLINSAWFQNDENEVTGVKYKNTQETIKGIMRRIIGLIDTDSNMVAIIMLFLSMEKIYGDKLDSPEFSNMDKDFTIVNAATIIVDNGTRYILEKYTDLVNIPIHHRSKVSFKNEYFYSTFALTSRIKNYIGLCNIKEGNVYDNPKVDVKGLMYTKSSVNRVVGDIVSEIINTDIIKSEKVDIHSLMNKITSTCIKLKADMLGASAADYFVSEKINDKLIDVIDSLSRTKSVEMYNILDVFDKIVPPSKFLTINIDFRKLEDMELDEDDSILLQRIECYRYIYMIHKNLKKIYKVDEVEIYNKRLIYIPKSIGDMAQDACINLRDFCYNYIMDKMDDSNNMYPLNIFRNGYAKKDEEINMTRDEMFYHIYKLEDGDLTIMLKKLINTHNTLKLHFDSMKVQFNNEYPPLIQQVIGKQYFAYKFVDLYDFNKISIPDSLSENIPLFISNLNNVEKDTVQIENLLSPVVESCNIVTSRNDVDRVNITNILNYY